MTTVQVAQVAQVAHYLNKLKTTIYVTQWKFLIPESQKKEERRARRKKSKTVVNEADND